MVEIFRIHEGIAETAPAEIIGAKAANIARIGKLGIPVPPAFVLPVALCRAVIEGDPVAEREVRAAITTGIDYLENQTGRRFGDSRRPLLVSVRSGAARSMPGMLDTVLDVGCTPNAVHGLIRMTGNPRFAWDCRRRFIESYAETVLGIERDAMNLCLDDVLHVERAEDERDLDCEALERLAADLDRMVEDRDLEIPEQPATQLFNAARAVYGSWMSERAVTYRKLQGLDDLDGTAVTVQAMVFGNRGLTSGAGVAFSRDPSKGGRHPLIEMLIDAQGEDVVAGRRTPDDEAAIELWNPSIAAQLRKVLSILESDFTDMQDIEFTIEDGQLWLLQTRTAKRTPLAALRVAVDLVREGVISHSVALQRLAGINLDALAVTRFAGEAPVVAQGIGAAAGVASGRAVFDSATAERFAQNGDPVILVRPDISTADIGGFAAAAGILTAVGGRTAHAALVARQLGKACVVGCAGLCVDSVAGRARLADAFVAQGDWISIDGDSGAVFQGKREITLERPELELAEVDRWNR